MRLRLAKVNWGERTLAHLGTVSPATAACLTGARDAVAGGRAAVSRWRTWDETYRHCACGHTMIFSVKGKVAKVIDLVDHRRIPHFL